MIARMLKVFVVVRAAEKDQLLAALRGLGVVHLAAVDPAKAKADEKTLSAIQALTRAEQILATVEPAGEPVDGDPLALADRAHELYTQAAEDRNRLTALAREADRVAMWGDVRLEQFTQLARDGWDVRFVSLPADEVSQISATCSAVVASLPDKKVLVAIVLPVGQEASLPESAEPVALPERDRPTILAEAKAIDQRLKEAGAELARLARSRDAMLVRREERIRDAAWTIADRGGAGNEDLYAVQGWVPQQTVETMQAGLAERGLVAAVETMPPSPEEKPPTLVIYPRWVRPMKAMFGILGTTPGYREYDLASFFMVALPLFAAMLIGDAGYGLIFTLAAILGWRKIKSLGGREGAELLLIFGLVTTAWGVLTGNLFGVSPQNMIDAGGIWAGPGKALGAVAWLWSNDEKTARDIIIKASFIFGSIHLVLAHLRQAVGLFPNQKFISELGWAAFLVGMLGIVWLLFFPDQVWMSTSVLFGLLIGGITMVLLFTYPDRNPVKRLGFGLLSSILPTLSTFSDTMSYIRLMAVGLASYYIASAFNSLAVQVAGGGIVMYLPAALIVVGAHALNIVLGIIAVFAHGVRLNMLEFSSNAGVQWEGYPYAPFAEGSKV